MSDSHPAFRFINPRDLPPFHPEKSGESRDDFYEQILSNEWREACGFLIFNRIRQMNPAVDNEEQSRCNNAYLKAVQEMMDLGHFFEQNAQEPVENEDEFPDSIPHDRRPEDGLLEEY